MSMDVLMGKFHLFFKIYKGCSENDWIYQFKKKNLKNRCPTINNNLQTLKYGFLRSYFFKNEALIS